MKWRDALRCDIDLPKSIADLPTRLRLMEHIEGGSAEWWTLPSSNINDNGRHRNICTAFSTAQRYPGNHRQSETITVII